MSEITIFLLYLLAAVAFGGSRLPRFAQQQKLLVVTAWLSAAFAVLLHGRILCANILTDTGFHLSLANTVSMIGLELALISLVAALEPRMRGIAAGLLVLGAIAAVTTGFGDSTATTTVFAWQLQAPFLQHRKYRNDRTDGE